MTSEEIKSAANLLRRITALALDEFKHAERDSATENMAEGLRYLEDAVLKCRHSLQAAQPEAAQ